MDTYINDLYTRLYLIRTMNWIKCEYNGTGCIGMQLEKLLGKNLDKKILPDYQGIEIKTKCTSRNMDKYGISLFSSSFDDYPLSIKNMFDKVKYFDFSTNKFKFQKRINSKRGLIVNDNYLKIYVDNKYAKVKLFIIDRNTHYIKSIHSWTFNELKTRLYMKLKYMVLVYARLYTVNNTKYVKYDDFHFYKLKSFECFINCLIKGYITINFNLIEYSNNHIDIYDKGTSFEINTNNLNELFEEIKKDN